MVKIISNNNSNNNNIFIKLPQQSPTYSNKKLR